MAKRARKRAAKQAEDAPEEQVPPRKAKKPKKAVTAEEAGDKAVEAEGGAEAAEEDDAYIEDEDDEEEDDDDQEECVMANDEEAEEEYADEDEEDNEEIKPVWRPGIDTIEEGEQLDVEPGTYDMLHRAQVQWPCLSFDVLRDDLGAQRTTFPMTAYVVAGSQADRSGECHIHMMKWSHLHKTLKDDAEDSDDDDDDEESDDDEEADAVLTSKAVGHPGGVNRIRAMPQAGHIVATWADTGKVYIWNLDAQRKALDTPNDKVPTAAKPIHTCLDHKDEGYALDFNPHQIGKLITGGNDGKILLWEPVKGGWNIAKDSPFTGHTSSVEDLQWKRLGPGTPHVFASASSDHSVRIWDCRENTRSNAATCIKEAHSSDVNVLSWSPCVGELLVTGADDGGFKIWDTRSVGAGPMANFQWHKKQVTSVDWHPTDETVLAVACADDSVSLWDMAVEDDSVGQEQAPGADFYPPQLLFLHQGQREPKEVKWHPQLPGVCISTAGSGFNIFKTCNI
mmetsp:Transcript_29808/g.69319  ORF Transcript_29808/g.69319 Transcript_29808/m.69319 type:complete len:509 (+) Transcript_29808:87-1613(+)